MSSPSKTGRALACTIHGRVVYDRPKHFFKLRDLTRLQDSIFRATVGETNAVIAVVRELSQRMIESVLALVGAQKFAEIVYYWMLYLVDRILNKLGVDPGLRFAQRLYQRLIEYYPPDQVTQITTI